jgi:branched-chain amino acid transport system substrate-binding protein
VEGVEAIVDLPHTGVVLALQEIAREKRKSLLVSGAASVEITGRSCSPFTTHWTDDTYALANGTARVMVKRQGESWFFLTADYSFGHDLERDASATIRSLGGQVLGSARHPLATNDFSSYLLQAQTTRAKIIGLASAGTDTVNAVKQAKEFNIEAGGQRLAALHAFVTDVNRLGLEAAQGLIITTGFYWDATEGTRDWSRRFLTEHRRMPTREQAGVALSEGRADHR